ncbi:MAG: hypothetical protein J6C80_01810 [Flavobacteriales bacterium]|nr:hypothetical protein [Flavobacteriales bacterium]
MKKLAFVLSFAVVAVFTSCASEPKAEEAVVEDAAVEVVEAAADSTACQEACCDSTAVCDSTAKAE